MIRDSEICFALVVLIVTFTIGLIFGAYMTESNYRSILVEKGFAQYCPNTGVFAYKGECDAATE